MLVINNENCAASKCNSSILNSPTLGRVERAMLRHDKEVHEKTIPHRITYAQSLLPSNYFDSGPYNAVKKGLLWQHRDKLFSRWKERYFILTRDYLHCFKRASGSDKISEMGEFLFKIKLLDIEKVEWANKRTYSIVALLFIGRDCKIYLKAAEGLEDWFELLEECTLNCKEKKRQTRNSCDQNTKDKSNTHYLDYWISGRKPIQLDQMSIDTVCSQNDYQRKHWLDQDDNWDITRTNNRLSLLSDIDINSYADTTIGSSSITSYRMNEDVLCIRPSSLRSTGGLRLPKEMNNIRHSETPLAKTILPINFRERSCSDMERFRNFNRHRHNNNNN